MLIYVFHNLRLESVDDIVFHIYTIPPHIFGCVLMLRYYLLIRYEMYICTVDGYNKKNCSETHIAAENISIWVMGEC